MGAYKYILPSLELQVHLPQRAPQMIAVGFHQGDYVDIVLSKVTCDLVLEGLVPSWTLALIPQLPLLPAFPETALLEAPRSGTWSSLGSV